MNNSIKFYNSLDRLNAQLELMNVPEQFTCSLASGGNATDTFVDFDAYKGSYLRLSRGNHLVINPTTALQIADQNTFLNFYFNAINTEDIQEILMSWTWDTLTIKLCLEPSESANINLKLIVDYSGSNQNDHDHWEIPTGISIRPDFWYNISIFLHKNGTLKIEIQGIEQVFTWEIADMLLSPTASFSMEEVINIELAGAANRSTIGFADMYIVHNATNEGIQEIINSGLNEAITYDYNQKIQFRLYSEFDGKSLLGLFKPAHDTSISYKLKIVKPENIRLAASHPQSQLTLQFKKGIIAPNEDLFPAISVDDDYDYIKIPLADTLNEIDIPHLQIINITSEEACLVHCILERITLYEDQFPIRNYQQINLDYLANIYDSNTFVAVNAAPLKLSIIGNDTLYNYDGNSNSIALELKNVSGASITFQHQASIEQTSILEITSPYLQQLLNSQNIQQIQGTVYTMVNGATQALSSFSSQVNVQTLRIQIKSNQPFELLDQQCLKLAFTNIKVLPPSVLWPSGLYPFQLHYRNIDNIPNHSLNFNLRYGNTETQQADSNTLNVLQADILKLKNSLEFVQNQLLIEGIQNKLAFKANQQTLLELETTKTTIYTDSYYKNALLYMPVGSVIAYVGNTAPYGWLLCDGTSFQASKYPELNRVLGKTTVPDLQRKVIVGSEPRQTQYMLNYNSATFYLINNSSIQPLTSNSNAVRESKDTKMTGSTANAQTQTTNLPQSYYVLSYIIKAL